MPGRLSAISRCARMKTTPQSVASACARLAPIVVTGALSAALLASAGAAAQDLRAAIRQIKPGVVAIATHQATRSPRVVLRATGFAVADGRHVITNLHAIPTGLNTQRKETMVVLAGTGKSVDMRAAEVIARDATHDVAILKIAGAPLPALRLGNDEVAEEGQLIAFTGFPIASVLGLYPVTHRGMISSITPIATPLPSAKALTVDVIRRLRDSYPVYQLDATAYPGNSGSPMFDAETAEVIGIVSSVFVQGSKELILKETSGITYAIPIRYAQALLRQLGVLD